MAAPGGVRSTCRALAAHEPASPPASPRESAWSRFYRWGNGDRRQEGGARDDDARAQGHTALSGRVQAASPPVCVVLGTREAQGHGVTRALTVPGKDEARATASPPAVLRKGGSKDTLSAQEALGDTVVWAEGRGVGCMDIL